MSPVDFSLPLATLLRESTHEAHEVVAKSPGAIAMLSGRLERDEYIRYLMMLWHIYDTFERALDRHATHPALEPTYNPTLLARADALSSDISFLLQLPEGSWRTHAIYTQLMASPPAPLTAYLSRLQHLADSEDPTPLLAHSYVRYLGDLSGGQTIRNTLGKAYGLEEGFASGLSFYAFKELRSSKSASRGEMKRIKDWFREGMNTAGKDSVDVKAAVLEEANTAFDLNTTLFTIIKVPDVKAQPQVVERSREIPIIVEQTKGEKGYSLAQVASFIAAMCLAHFLLVVGGFTGDRGYEKLATLGQWLATTWQPMN